MKSNIKIEESPFYNNKSKDNIFLQNVKNLEDNYSLVRRKYYNSNEYTKFIIQKEEDLSIFFSLSNTSKNLLYYIINILDYNSVTFRLKVKEVCNLLKKDTSTVYKARNELIKADYIARTKTREVYFINHNRFFKGNFSTEITLKRKNNDRK